MTTFRYSIANDENRADDGINLRSRFIFDCSYNNSVLGYLDGPCSVLEMLVALAHRCEEQIMDDPDIGDRTGQWFWMMIKNLGLESMTDDQFDEEFVNERVSIFLDREYESNGEGGLFVLDNCRYDLRTVEIWYQMCWYLNTIL
jgi:hypothetical protein